MGLIVYNQYFVLEKLRQLELQSNDNWSKRFQASDIPAHFDKQHSFCNKRHVHLKIINRNNKSVYMVNSNSFTIQGKFIVML